MSFTRYIIQTIRHYRRLNFTVVLGIALSTAILAGALVIGDSVKYSLEQIAVQRLGKTSKVIVAGERLFGQHLAKSISAKTGVNVSALLRANGFGVVNGGERRINQLAVWGIDSTFNNFGVSSRPLLLKDNEVAINENLASLSGLKAGDELLLRLNKLSTFPANTPFVSEQESCVSFRATVSRILKPGESGNFNLQNIQSAPRNVFVNIQWLNRMMGLQQKANVLLLAESKNADDPVVALRESWSVDDLNLKIRENQSLDYTELISDRVFVEPAVEQFCLKSLPGSSEVFSYFINRFSLGDRQTPYSFVSTDPQLSENQMAVSEWLASDLNAKIGDAVRVSYFVVGPLRRLVEHDTTLVIRAVYKMEGAKADPNLMPEIPGLSDVDNCRDWKTGVPVDLKKIRPVDEQYWNRFKGTPKAFVSPEMARKLWENRFGQSTAIQVKGLKKNEVEQVVLSGLSPAQAGYEVRNVKTDGLQAASSGTDFGGLFIGLSFFVLFAAILLSFMLFRLYLNFRKSEIGTLMALGFSFKQLRKLFFAETAALVFSGILIGLPFAVLYNQLILKAVNSIWVDIVRTSIVNIYVRPGSLLVGSVSVALISFAFVWFLLNRFLKDETIALQKKVSVQRVKSGRWSFAIGVGLIVVSFVLLFVLGFRKGEVNPGMFFISGFGLLPGLILLFDFALCKISAWEKVHRFSAKTFLLKRIAGDRRRNVMMVSFLSIGVYLVVSTGLNRKDMTAHAGRPSSGTGGYAYFVETTVPVLFDVNGRQGREEFGWSDSVQIVPFQVQQGDDASCLNLNHISRPRIMAFDPRAFDRRSAFTFATQTDDLDAQHPWLTLDQTLPGGVVPAIADQTVIQWGLMKNVGDTLHYKTEEGRELRLKLVGGLANSVFQGSVLIAENHFNEAFPSVSGSNVFLFAAAKNSLKMEDLQEDLRNYGPEISKTTDRLLSFYTVENTYLNIFLMLGALGLLIGTVGLGILIFRTTFEQIPEFALMLSLGFAKSAIQQLVIREKFFLMIFSVFIGLIPAVLSALPSLVSSLYGNLWIWLPGIAVLVLLSGTIFSLLAIQMVFRQNLLQALRNE
jgi:putative ABC transport system permease protein